MGYSVLSLLSVVLAVLLSCPVAADTISPGSRLAAFALRINDVNGDNVMGPHIFYQSTDGTVREVYWTIDHKWKQGSFQSDVPPRANTPLAVVSAPAVGVATTVRFSSVTHLSGGLDADERPGKLAVMYVDVNNNLRTRVYDPNRKTW